MDTFKKLMEIRYLAPVSTNKSKKKTKQKKQKKNNKRIKNYELKSETKLGQ